MKITLSIILFLLSVLGLPSQILAQDNGAFHVNVTNHPTDVPKSKSEAKPPVVGEDNIIKINFFNLLFVGELPIYYERRINTHLCAEVGLGPTFYFLNVADPLFYPLVSNQQVESDLAQSSTQQMGFTAKFSFKYFPSGESPEGFYIAPEIRFKQYHEQISGVQIMDYNNNSIVNNNPFGRTLTDLDVVGVLGFNIISDNYLFSGNYDIYAGFGVRFRNYDAAGEVIDPGSGGTDLLFTPKNDAIPYFTIGLKVGLVL